MIKFSSPAPGLKRPRWTKPPRGEPLPSHGTKVPRRWIFLRVFFLIIINSHPFYNYLPQPTYPDRLFQWSAILLFICCWVSKMLSSKNCADWRIAVLISHHIPWCSGSRSYLLIIPCWYAAPCGKGDPGRNIMVVIHLYVCVSLVFLLIIPRIQSGQINKVHVQF